MAIKSFTFNELAEKFPAVEDVRFSKIAETVVDIANIVESANPDWQFVQVITGDSSATILFRVPDNG